MSISIPSLILLVVVTGAIVGFFWWLAAKRRSDVAGLTPHLQQHGWTWAERDDQVFAGLTAIPFGRGHSQRAHEVIQGTEPVMRAFTFRWTTGSGDNRNRHVRRVTMIKAGPVIPLTEVEPDTVVAKLETAAAGGDLNVELADFNKAWSVRATDQRISHALLHPRMIERFMQPDLYGRGVFFEQGWIGVIDHVVQVRDVVDHTRSTLAIASDLADLIPPHLVRELA
jgi:hypothetical protein